MTFLLIVITIVVTLTINKKGVSMYTLNVKDFPSDLHREMKIRAAMLGIPLRELVIRAVKDFLKKQKKGG